MRGEPSDPLRRILVLCPYRVQAILCHFAAFVPKYRLVNAEIILQRLATYCLSVSKTRKRFMQDSAAVLCTTDANDFWPRKCDECAELREGVNLRAN